MDMETASTITPAASQQSQDGSDSGWPTRQARVDDLPANHDDETTPHILPQTTNGAAESSGKDIQRDEQPSVDSEDTQSDRDEDEFPITRPKGKMASRMNITGYGTRDTSSGEDEPIGAYARIRKQIMAEGSTDGATRSKPAVAAGPNHNVEPDASDGEDEDEDEIQSKPRRRRLRQKHGTVTAASDALPSSPQSPGLFVSPHKPSTAPQTTGYRRSGSITSVSSLEAGLGIRSPTRDTRTAATDDEAGRQRTETDHDEDNVSTDPIDAAESDSDSIGGARLREKLTQQTRPTRKASKKAIAEMQRETQRMSRNMQLGYRETTKKRFSTKDLFQRFNFKEDMPTDPMKLVPTAAEKAGQSKGKMHDADTRTTLASSDLDISLPDGAETPPTSPLDADESFHSNAKEGSNTDISTQAPEDNDIEAPSVKELLRQGGMTLDKGKGRALVDEQVERDDVGNVVRSFRIKAPEILRPGQQIALDSDEELSPPKSRLAVFDRVAPRKKQQPRSLLVQRSLAHITSPGRSISSKSAARHAATPASLQNDLRLKAHQQALEAKREHIASLRARGIYVETEEEKQEREEFVADSLQRARQEAQQIADREREERKQGRAFDGDVDMLSSDEDEDYSAYSGSEGEEQEGPSGASDSDGSEDVELAELDLSGSSEEEEEQEEDEDEDEEEGAKQSNEHAQGIDIDGPTNLGHDNTVDGTDGNGPPSGHGIAMNDALPSQSLASQDEDSHRTFATHNRHRRRHVVDDDEDEPAQDTHKSSQDDALAAFGFGISERSPVTMSQMFVGTMANFDSQSQGSVVFQRNHESQEDSLAFLRDLPPTDLPDFNAVFSQSQAHDHHTQLAPQRSQAAASPVVGPEASQSQRPSVLETPSRFSEAPDPTQDEGFHMSQGIPVDPHSTTDTVVLGAAESPVMTKKKGRLVRRYDTGGEDVDRPDSDVEFARSAAMEQGTRDSLYVNPAAIDDAFQKMRRAAKRNSNREAFDKQKSGAKEMMDEQAEESEDEYAGIGGVSDDEAGEEDEEDRAMINNETVKIDERKIAALHAEQTRIENERRVNQLYNDITTGAFRRRRGGELELSDDEDDVAAERRRRKQREFARRTKALLADEKIGQLAEHTKKQAFLTAIADRDEEEEAFDFLDDPEADAGEAPEHSQQVLGQLTPSENTELAAAIMESDMVVSSTAPQKRKMPNTNDRRTNLSKRPRTELELKKTISDLIEEPILIPDSQFSDDEEPGALDGQAASALYKSAMHEATASNDATTAGPRPVTDRLALAELSDTTVNATIGTAMAFQTGESTTSLFKVPALLRRTTTNLSIASTTSSTSASGATTPVGIEHGGTKRGGSKKSNIHYQAREAERRRAVEESDRRRKDGVKKKVTGRAAGGSVLGRMIRGSRGGFE